MSPQSVTIRPARPDDAWDVYAMYQKTSRRSLYQRYIRRYQPSLEDVREMCSIHPARGAVLLAFADKHTVAGYAYYMIESDGLTAEPAMMVTDPFQGMGIGQRLLVALKNQAVLQGVQAFHATLDADNERMMHLIRKMGSPYKSEVSHGIREIYIHLAR